MYKNARDPGGDVTKCIPTYHLILLFSDWPLPPRRPVAEPAS
jgi:hypothetical protein